MSTVLPFELKRKMNLFVDKKSVPKGVEIYRNGQTRKLTVNKAKKRGEIFVQFCIQEFENITFDNFRVSNEYFTEKPTFFCNLHLFYF